MRQGFGGVLAAKCVPGRNSNSHYLHGALKRNPGAVSLPKNGIIPGFFGGEISAGSQSKFAFSSGGSNKKNRRPRRKNAPGFRVFVFAAKFAPRRNSNFISPQRALKKTQRRFRRRKKKTQAPLVFFCGEVRSRSQCEFAAQWRSVRGHGPRVFSPDREAD